MNSFFYSGQIRRFLQQFIRLLNNFQVEIQGDSPGTRSLLQVPIYYGDSSRQAATILRNNSENSLSAVPAMSVYIDGLKYDQTRLQEPFHVSKMYIRERARGVDGNYTSEQGDLLTVERLMPVPYILSLKCDIWTSNTEQKLQLLEQIAVLFNPSLEIQSTDNYVDWASLTYITLTGTNFSSRSIPVGTDDPIDVATLSFEMPIWLSAPAKVKRMGVIQKIIGGIWDSAGTIDHVNGTFDISASTLLARQAYTPIDHNILYIGNTLRLFPSSQQSAFIPSDNFAVPVANWETYLRNFGTITNGISQIRLSQDDITIVGIVATHPTDAGLLLFSPIVDTMPANNLSAVNAIIDPRNVTVNNSLIAPVQGTRYLILADIGVENEPGALIWNRSGFPTLVAAANDIIEYTGTHWTVSFASTGTTDVKYITNLTTNIQYKWKDSQWSKSVEGRYGAGAWSFVP
jgi:hypothetical protein